MFKINTQQINSGFLVFFQCATISAIIVGVAGSIFKDFFFIDDAQNQNLPFYREMGRIWLSGHLPIFTTHAFFGGNILLDMVLSPFSPQTIATSILAAKTESFRVAANFLAWLNISLVMLGGYWLGRIYAIRPSYSLLLGFCTATNPIFLYVFSASWWNLASAYAWFVVSFAGLMQYRLKQEKWVFAVCVFSACALFASAGTQIQVGYLLFALITVIVDFVNTRRLDEAINFSLIVICALLISACPNMLEYVLSKEFIERSSEFSNHTAFAVPSWGFVINFFNPFYGTYMNWWGGFRYMPLSFGYATILSLALIFRYKLRHKSELSIFIYFLFFSILLSFSSNQFGPLFLPFRYLPIFGLLVVFITFFILEHSKLSITPFRVKLFLCALLFSAIIQLFSADNLVFIWKHSRYVLLFIVLGLVLLATFLNKKLFHYTTQIFGFIAFAAWLVLVIKTHTLGNFLLSYPALKPGVAGIPAKKPTAYVLGLAPGNSPAVSNLNSGQYLLFDIKSINGYSSVGHKGFSRYFPHDSAHGMFEPVVTLKHLTQPSGVNADVFDYQLFNIGYIFAHPSSITSEINALLAQARLKIDPQLREGRLLIMPETPYPAEGSLTYQTVDGAIKLDHSNGMLHEWFDVAPATIERTLIFSRVYWHGYHAVMNGQEYPVSSYKDVLLKVVLPAGVSGKLHLYYEPVSWKYTKWSILLGLALFCTVLIRRHGNDQHKNASKAAPAEL